MGSKYAGTEDEIKALSAYINLVRASEAILSASAARLARHRMTISQMGALDALYHLGPMHQTDLARKILKSNGNLTFVIDNLEKQGLVARTRDPRDRRCITVKLTSEGRRKIEEVLPIHATGVAALFSRLSPDEQETLRALTRKLGKGNRADES